MLYMINVNNSPDQVFLYSNESTVQLHSCIINCDGAQYN